MTDKETHKAAHDPAGRNLVGRSTEIAKLFAEITKIAAGIGIIVGVIAGILGMINTVQSLKSSAAAAKERAYPQVKQVIEEDNQIKPVETAFLNEYAGEDGNQKLRQLIKDKGSVSQAYYSDELAGLREIGHHYEEMGAMVKHGYIDFDFIYDVVPFPDAFWTQTEEFRHAARSGNWENGKPLPDFWMNFSLLHNQYEKKRREINRPADTDR
jgi:hypothetical protein